jgi:hypothetical protein
MGVGENVFAKAIAAVRFRIGNAIENAIAFRILDLVFKIPFLFVAKRAPVADEKLQVARIRLVDGGIVDLVHDAMAQREPHPTACVIGGAQAFLGARCPARLDARCSECDRVFIWSHAGSP